MNEITVENEIVEITSYSHDGRGIAHVEGKTTFVAGALVGESAEVKTIKKHSQFDEVIATKISNPSPDRVEPQCAHFGVCGGCSLQHINPEKQIEMKQAALLDLLKRSAKIEPKTILPAITGPHWQYRHKARLGVKYVVKKEKVLIGFREVDSRFLADISHCHVLHPTIGEKIDVLGELIASLSVFNQIPQVEIAVGDKNTAIIVRHLKPFIGGDIEKLKAFAEQHNIHVYLQPKGPKTITKLWPADNNLRLHYQLNDLTMAFHPVDFTQVNPEINRKMVAKAIELLALDSNDNVLDLFSGLGNFTLQIAKKAKSVVGVEGGKEMVLRSYENAKTNNIKNVEFYYADLFQSISAEAWAKKRYDKVLIDPPRSGAIQVLPWIEKWQPSRVVYVSCNPATLARDTAEMLKMDYHLQAAGVLDMFPHTSHMETIALFIKGK